ncbi:sensor histidine kinase [Mucilaginibacter puniceus]
MNISKVILFRHLLVWALFILYELALINITVGLLASPLQYVIYYALNIFLFYGNAHIILDFAFFRTSRPYLISIALIILELLFFLWMKLHIDVWLTGGGPVRYALDTMHEKIYLTNIFREIFFIGFSIAYWSMLYMVKFKERNHFMEKESLRQITRSLELENKFITAENAFLQNQISPHLLFNTLNFIFNAVHKLSDRAGKGVMLLSELMRYSLLSSQDNRMVPLLAEIGQIDKLIELSALRFQGEIYLKFTKKGKLKEVMIPPLILLTLVENMLKHGDLGDRSNSGKIDLEVNQNGLHFTTQNLKRKSTPYPSSGVGLKNIKKRLANLFPERHQLAVTENDSIFKITLTLNL